MIALRITYTNDTVRRYRGKGGRGWQRRHWITSPKYLTENFLQRKTQRQPGL